eukprot:403335932
MEKPKIDTAKRISKIDKKLFSNGFKSQQTSPNQKLIQNDLLSNNYGNQQKSNSQQQQSPYPFTFQGKLISHYTDLLEFCELAKPDVLLQQHRQQQLLYQQHLKNGHQVLIQAQYQKNFDEELFKLIQEIKKEEKMHLRKPSTLDNLVMLQKIDEYYFSKDQSDQKVKQKR